MVDVGNKSRFFLLHFFVFSYFLLKESSLFFVSQHKLLEVVLILSLLKFNIRLINIHVPCLNLFAFIIQIEVKLAKMVFVYFETINLYDPFLTYFLPSFQLGRLPELNPIELVWSYLVRKFRTCPLTVTVMRENM